MVKIPKSIGASPSLTLPILIITATFSHPLLSEPWEKPLTLPLSRWERGKKVPVKINLTRH